MFRVVSEDEVRALQHIPGDWKAIEAAYQAFGQSPDIQSRPSIMTIDGPRPVLGSAALGQYRIKGAVVPNVGAAGAFLYTRENPYIYLWNSDADEPIGLVAANWLSQYRVALTVAYAIELLAAAPVRRIAFYGAGRFGADACRLLADRWPDASIELVTSTPERSAIVAASMPPNVRGACCSREAVEGADVVVTLTNAKAPLIGPGWLRPGALLLSMGSAHEVEAAVLEEADAFIVDDFSYAQAQGDIAAWIREGVCSADVLARRMRANIGEISAGLKQGRANPGEKILAILQGLTACDISLAKTILDRAADRGVGQTVSL